MTTHPFRDGAGVGVACLFVLFGDGGLIPRVRGSNIFPERDDAAPTRKCKDKCMFCGSGPSVAGT